MFLLYLCMNDWFFRLRFCTEWLYKDADGEPEPMRRILERLMAQVQDPSLDLLTCSPYATILLRLHLSFCMKVKI